MRDDGADVGNGLQRVDRRLSHRRDGAERAREGFGATLAHMADADAMKQPPDFRAAALVDFR